MSNVQLDDQSYANRFPASGTSHISWYAKILFKTGLIKTEAAAQKSAIVFVILCVIASLSVVLFDDRVNVRDPEEVKKMFLPTNGPTPR